MEEKKLAVIALGGNAILRGNQKGTVEEQNQNIRETLENLIYLVREGYNTSHDIRYVCGLFTR